jgi:hypothetical protein
MTAMADHQTPPSYLAITTGNSSHLVEYLGDNLSRLICHGRVRPSAANCTARLP